MAFFDRVNRTISETGQRAKDLADIAKLNEKITENNNRIKQLYLESGELYCKVHATDAEAEFARYITSLAQMKVQNEEWNEEVQRLRGLVKCSNCGNYIAKNAPFCTSCGQRLLPESSVVCPGCGAVWEKGMFFCQQCGTRLPGEQPSVIEAEKTVKGLCSECGAEMSKDALFCSNCGAKKKQEQPENSFSGTNGNEPVSSEQISAPQADGGTSRCINCGAELDIGAVFCSECGARKN
ncbi:MAG: zinc ribbon domain-containing protein [Clostridiales bacterium]|nr:zinc ribbon domain-containing protein [Clostridiales bacterium]